MNCESVHHSLEEIDGADTRAEVVERIFGTQADFDGMPRLRDVPQLRQRAELAATGHEELKCNEVYSNHFFSNWVLHLNSGVDFEEVKSPGLNVLCDPSSLATGIGAYARVRHITYHNELDGPCRFVLEKVRDLESCARHLLSQRGR